MQFVPGVRFDSPDCSDFLYQINRPRASTLTEGEPVNRLSKWSAAASQTVHLNLLPISRQTLAPVSAVKIATRLELDISTRAYRTSPLDHSTIPAIFDELLDLGLEISERGDID